jgi:hypothetical protein
MLGCVLEPGHALVIFSPVCDKKLVHFPTASYDPSHVESAEVRHRDVVKTARTKFRDGVVDTSAFVPRHWSYRELCKFWQDVVRTYANRVVLPYGWNFDEDLANIFYTALRSGCLITSLDGQPITNAIAVDLLRRATQETDNCGRDASLFRVVIRKISKFRSVD